MTSKTTKIVATLLAILAGITVEIIGIVVMAQAFPDLASQIWTWLTNLSASQLITGYIGYLIYKFGVGWNQGVGEAIKEARN